jgi:hypothetical protein
MEPNRTVYFNESNLKEDISTCVVHLDQLVLETLKEYNKIRSQLKLYEGEEVQDHQDRMKSLLFELKNKYSQIFPILRFITRRSGWAEKIIDDFNILIGDMVEMGLYNIDDPNAPEYYIIVEENLLLKNKKEGKNNGAE